MEEEQARRLFLDELLNLRVGPLARVRIDGRARLIDQLVESLDPRVVLAHPAAGLRVIEGVQDRIGVEDRVVAPGAVIPMRRLAVGLEELVPRRSRVPDL